ncbi:hypothetical protein HK104_004204 [Borealophlyctis nickersoniae]|nr:hypothetical protein HK104_004204 [Borealophlyctis nickersoniae]
MGFFEPDIQYIEGYFNESLVEALPLFTAFSVVRLDGNTYESTWDAINIVYPLLSINGYIIIDDYTDWIGCKEAIDDYRTIHSIDDPIRFVQYQPGEYIRGAYWKKTRNITPPTQNEPLPPPPPQPQNRTLASLPLRICCQPEAEDSKMGSTGDATGLAGDQET